MSNKLPKKIKAPETVEQQIRRRTIKSFAVFLLLAVAGWYSWQWLYHTPPAKHDTVQKPLRKVLEVNEQLFTTTFDTARKAKKYSVKQAAKKVRVNGNIGMTGDNDTLTWRLHVVRGEGDTLSVSLADIMKLPKTQVVFDFKCIEGWDQISHWAGVRMIDFLKAYHLDKQEKSKYIGLITPDGGYYVGIDMPSAIQDQTILCYELNGAPLPQNQGYPLRLIIPVKYGIKHLKQIGTLFFSDTPPNDYWAERGYDYYSGH